MSHAKAFNTGYIIGYILGDAILIGTGTVSIWSSIQFVIKITKRLDKFAANYALPDDSDDTVSDNLLECLDYID